MAVRRTRLIFLAAVGTAGLCIVSFALRGRMPPPRPRHPVSIVFQWRADGGVAQDMTCTLPQDVPLYFTFHSAAPHTLETTIRVQAHDNGDGTVTLEGLHGERRAGEGLRAGYIALRVRSGRTGILTDIVETRRNSSGRVIPIVIRSLTATPTILVWAR